MTLSSTATPDQSGLIPQSSSIIGALTSDCLVLYPGHSLGGGSYLFAEKLSMYSTASANKARSILDSYIVLFHLHNLF